MACRQPVSVISCGGFAVGDRRALRAARRGGAGVPLSRPVEPACAVDPCVEGGDEGLFAEFVCAPTATLHASRTAVAAAIDIRFMKHLRYDVGSDKYAKSSEASSGPRSGSSAGKGRLRG